MMATEGEPALVQTPAAHLASVIEISPLSNFV
jgi:hypothetical protein